MTSLEAGERLSGADYAEGSRDERVNDAGVRVAAEDCGDPASTISVISPKWSDSERRAWQLPEALTVAEWADRYRFLDPMTSAEAGQWMTDRTPYLRGIMDAFTDPGVKKIVIVSATQVGKTECLMNCLGYTMDQDPAPALWVAPRADDSEAIAKDRVAPMIRLSPNLARHKTEYDDDVGKKVIRIDRMFVYFAGANSPAALSSKPIRYLFLDEVDKYPPFSGREADPVKLATQRTSTFWNSRVVMSSTPTTKKGYIWREYQLSDRRVYFVPCPHCGDYQRLAWGQVRFPKEARDPEEIQTKRLAHYECSKCKKKIEDRHKSGMLLRGVWAPESCVVLKDGRIVGEIPASGSRGFWINALYSPWITFSDMAAEWLRSQESSEMLMNFINSWLAEVWEQKTEDTTESKIAKIAMNYRPGSVPMKAIVLTAGVDVQKDYMKYSIHAWGPYGEQWLVKAGRAENWSEIVIDVLESEFLADDGVKFQVRLACIDTGHRTDEAYEFVRQWSDCARAIKGVDRITGVPWRVTKIDRMPDGKVIDGGLNLWSLDTTFFKDKITRMIQAGPDDRAKWHVYQDRPEDYDKEFCAECKIIPPHRGRRPVEAWVKKAEHLKNDFWDTAVYATAAAEMLRVSALREEHLADLRAQTPAPAQPQEREEHQDWVGRRRGWLR